MDYRVLSAKLRVKPTFSSQEEIIQKDYPLKLPNRTFLTLWNTPEVSQFRGFQDDADEREKKQAVIRQEQNDIRTAAQEVGGQVLPDMNIAHEMLNQQRQSASALAAHQADLAATTRQQMEGMQAEQRAEPVHGVAEAVAHHLGKGARVVPMDGFHYDDRVLEARGLRSRKQRSFLYSHRFALLQISARTCDRLGQRSARCDSAR